MSCQADLKVEAGALRHGGEGRDGRHRGEGTHQHKDTPAMELVGWAHLETPAYMRKGSKKRRETELQHLSFAIKTVEKCKDKISIYTA